MSDDLAMEALSGTLAERAGAAIAAGCDVALHCSGGLAENEAVAGALGEIERGGARAARPGHGADRRQGFDARAMRRWRRSATRCSLMPRVARAPGADAAVRRRRVARLRADGR